MVPMHFESIPNGWTRESWNDCLLLGHPEGGFVTVDFKTGIFCMGMDTPSDHPIKENTVAQQGDQWQEKLVEKAMIALAEGS